MNKLKKTAFLIIILIFVLFCSSCAREVKNIPTETILENGEPAVLANNSAVDFYFYYPENWIIDKNAAMITIYFESAEILKTDIELSGGENVNIMSKPNISANVLALEYGSYKTVEDFWANFALPQFEKLYDDMEFEPTEDLIVDGVLAKKYTYTCFLWDMKYKISQIIFINKSRVYTLIYTTTEPAYEKYIDVLNTAVETFKFK